jgi:hypothetical protein
MMWMVVSVAISAMAVHAASREETMIEATCGNAELSIIVPSTTKEAATVQIHNGLSDPWIRAMIITPSMLDFMKTTPLGRTDFRTLAQFIGKPASIFTMTFSQDDPYSGMPHGTFSGRASVCLSYKQ